MDPHENEALAAMMAMQELYGAQQTSEEQNDD